MSLDARLKTTIALLLVTAIASACTIRQGDFSVITNRLVHLDRVDIDDLPRAKRVKGEDTKVVFVLFIPLPPPTLEGAVDDALKKGEGDLITDAVISLTTMNYILFATQKMTVEGDVVKTRKGN